MGTLHAIEAAAKFEFGVIPVGSRVTVNPPPMDTDADYLVLVKRDRLLPLAASLINDGWDCGGSLDATADRATFRKGDDNLIITCNEAFYDSFLACTAVAIRLNLTDKADRIALFDEMRKHWPGLKAPSMWLLA